MTSRKIASFYCLDRNNIIASKLGLSDQGGGGGGGRALFLAICTTQKKHQKCVCKTIFLDKFFTMIMTSLFAPAVDAHTRQNMDMTSNVKHYKADTQTRL